ncbi:MAG TPA: ribonuclease III [Alphaproteobacteria bacterium]|nr:ribonuclease III [Alphaproteobacteria bacterium]
MARSAQTKEIGELERQLEHNFTDQRLLTTALTHSSVAPDFARNYQRLEFLGDRVLALIVADLLMQHYPHAAEGELAPRLNSLVCKQTCADVARQLSLGPWLRMSEGEAANGGREKDAILGDVCEALIGALYLDGGEAAARQFVTRLWQPRVSALVDTPVDPKSALQEWSQARKLGTPDYVLVSRSGPDHAPEFLVEAQLPGLASVQGRGSSKREAERDAASALLASIKDKKR